MEAMRVRLEGLETRQRRLKYVVGVVLVVSGVLLALDYRIVRIPR